MKKITMALLGISIGITVEATPFTDTFERADGGLGTDWTTVWGNPQIITGTVNMASTAASGLANLGTVGLVITEAQTLDTNFTVQIDLIANGGSPAAAGLIMNYTATNSFYVFRMLSDGNLQFGKIADGTTVNYGFSPAGTEFSFLSSGEYRLIVESSTPGTFDFSISTLSGGIATLVYSNSWTDGGTALSGGYSGFYLNGGSTPRFDNFSVVPEPGSVSLIVLSAGILFIARKKFLK